jgi:hypothetical protein
MPILMQVNRPIANRPQVSNLPHTGKCPSFEKADRSELPSELDKAEPYPT